MAEISKINANSTSYDIKDAPSRTALGEVINGGAAGTKNLFPSFDTKSSGSVTYSYANGTVSASGTKSSGVNYVDIVENRPISELGLRIGDIIKLYNTSDNLRLGVVLGDGTTFDSAITAGNEVKEVTIGTGKTHIYIRMQILSTVTGTINLSSTPMICRKTLYDANPDYEPNAPAKTNVEITPALVELVDSGAKNVLRFDAISRTSHNGVDFTYNADGSVTVNAASSASDNAFCYLNLDGNNVDVKALCDGNHVIAGCPTNSGGVTLRIMGTGYTTVTDSGNGATMTAYSGENVIRVAVYVAKNGTPSNIKIKPMICTAADWAISQTYQPYRPSMQEMYQMILALQNGTRFAPALAMAETEETKEPETGEEGERR